VVDSANPIIFARLGSDPSQPTIVIHGHYDVQVRAGRAALIPEHAAVYVVCFVVVTLVGNPLLWCPPLYCLRCVQPADTEDWATGVLVWVWAVGSAAGLMYRDWLCDVHGCRVGLGVDGGGGRAGSVHRMGLRGSHFWYLRYGCPPPVSDPFVLTGQDGYLYGRGASDNKGSVLAAIFAAALCRQGDTPFGEDFDAEYRKCVWGLAGTGLQHPLCGASESRDVRRAASCGAFAMCALYWPVLQIAHGGHCPRGLQCQLCVHSGGGG
jgi:hypothetical protein